MQARDLIGMIVIGIFTVVLVGQTFSTVSTTKASLDKILNVR